MRALFAQDMDSLANLRPKPKEGCLNVDEPSININQYNMVWIDYHIFFLYIYFLIFYKYGIGRDYNSQS